MKADQRYIEEIVCEVDLQMDPQYEAWVSKLSIYDTSVKIETTVNTDAKHPVKTTRLDRLTFFKGNEDKDVKKLISKMKRQGIRFL